MACRALPYRETATRIMPDNEDRETMPPSHPLTEAPGDADTSGPRTMLPAAMSLHPDPNSWVDRQIQVLIDAMAESKAARAAYDPEALLKTSTDRIERLVGANYSMIHSELRAVAARTTANETGIEQLRSEFEALKQRMGQLEIAINQQHLQVLNRVVFLDIIISRIIIEITLWCLNIIVVWIGIKLIGDRVTIDNFEDIMIAVAGVLALAVSWGTFCGFMLAFFSFWGKTANLVTRIMYFTSGVFYVPDQMIPFVRDIIVWSPLMHLVELFRRGVYYGYGSLLLNVYYPFLISLIFMTLAALIEDKAERRMRSA